MQILKILLKNELSGLLLMNNMFDTKKGKAKNPALMALGAVVFGVGLMGLSGLYSYLLAVSLIQLNAVYILPVAMFVAGSLVVFFYCALRSSGVLFTSNDYDLLLSLPISERTIMLSKLIYLYISDLFYAMVFMLPCLGVWWYFQRPELLSVLLALLCLPFVPVIPIILATIIGTLVAFFTGRSRHKAFMGIMANLVLVFGIFGLSSLLSRSNQPEIDLANYAISMQDMLIKQYPPARLFFNATQGDVASFLIFAVLSLAIFALFTLLLAKVFKPLHSKLTSVSMKKSAAKLQYSDTGCFVALIKREAKRFLSSSVYFVNCGIGALMGLAGVVYILFFGSAYVAVVMETPVLYASVLAILPAVAGVFSSISCTSAVSVSLEGQSLWVIKQLPVSGYSVFMSKIAFNLLLTAPVSLLISVVGIFLFKISGFYAIITLIYPLIVCAFIAYAGLVINLKFPSFTWTSETKVVKQSASMGIVTAFAMTIAGGTFALVSLVFKGDTAYLAYLILGTVMLSAVIIWNRYLKKNSDKILLRF